MITYKKELVEAIKRTESYGFNVSDFFIEGGNVTYLGSENKTKLFSFLFEHVYKHEIDKIAFHCFEWSFYLKNEIENILCCDSILTIGYVDFLGKCAFKSEIEEIVSWMSKSSSELRLGSNLHIWLTLPSLEIIDITIAASFLRINPTILGDIRDYRNCLMCLPQESYGLESFVHRPQFVGADFLYKTGIAQDWQINENGEPIFRLR